MDFHISAGMSDSHFHIMEMKRKGMDVAAVFNALKEAGAGLLLDVGVVLENFEERLSWQSSYDQLCFTAGIHPNIPQGQWPANWKDILEQQISHPMVKAVGETGLDFFRDYSSEEEQRELLEQHYKFACDAGKPLIFHIRNAEDAMRLWIRERDFPCGGVLHCFPGNLDLAETALGKGMYISFAGNVTFKNAALIRESLEIVPLDRLLLETDAPYLAPHPKRGRDNHPGLIGYSYEFVASQKSLETDDLIRITSENLKNFLKLG